VAKPVTAAAASKSDTATPAAAKSANSTAPVAKAAAVPPAPVAAPTIPFNRGIVVLDAAHGGTDNGSRLTDSLVEKDVTLGLAFKLRSLLAARGFTVVMTRDGEGSQTDTNAPAAVLGLDDRAGMANHAHAVACLLLHATAAGQGVHLYSSELAATGTQPTANPWLSAQAPWVTESQNLEKSLGVALHRSNINIIMSRGSVRPLDSLTCPALVIELAPDSDDADTLNDGEYQQKVATAMAGALLNWKNDAQPPLPATAGVQP
jgi:N-acetylmuramoyl-L-alanine amidase